MALLEVCSACLIIFSDTPSLTEIQNSTLEDSSPERVLSRECQIRPEEQPSMPLTTCSDELVTISVRPRRVSTRVRLISFLICHFNNGLEFRHLLSSVIASARDTLCLYCQILSETTIQLFVRTQCSLHCGCTLKTTSVNIGLRFVHAPVLQI